jgi:hypothetical protein
LAKDTQTIDINHPIVQIVEAKRDNLDDAQPQCAAQMVGASIFNENRQSSIPKIYGCVTNGIEWQFLMLEQQCIYLDKTIYYTNHLPELLGVFQEIINYYKKTLT